MPEIHFEAAGFASGVIAQVGVVSAAEADLLSAAVRMGDVSMFGGPGRPLIELLWRFSMVRSALDNKEGCWHKSESYRRLDASEKSSVSYFLGMVQASFMARSLLGVTDVAHVDAVLRLRGTVTRRSRPDLVGYQGTPTHVGSLGRVLIEAKGRTGDYAQKPLDVAKLQLTSPPTEVAQLVGTNSLAIASLAYFAGGSAWNSYLVDPPSQARGSQEVSDGVLRGLVSLAALLPVASAIDNLQQVNDTRVRRDRSTEMVEATLPDVGVTLGMPIELYENVRQFAPPRAQDADARALGWAEQLEEQRAMVVERQPEVEQRRENREFVLDRDGVLIDIDPEPFLTK